MNILIKEGTAELEVPQESLTRKSSTFFNPYMKHDRDLTCEVLKVLGKKRVCDALCGTGARGIRYALESESEAWANDANPQASQLARANVKRNGLDFPVTCADANVLLREQKFDAVDIDPFGSPVPFLDSAICALHKNSHLFVTATDTAALFCSTATACLRKYNITPIKTDFSKELGVRILLSKIMRVASSHSFSFRVLLAYAHRHYVRVFLEARRGKTKAASSVREMGFIYVCACGERTATTELVSTCPRCGEKFSFSYPLYLGRLKDDAFLGLLPDNWILSKIKKEIDVPLYYDMHRLSSLYRFTPPSLDDLIYSLREKGFSASKTHFCPTGLKTDGSLGEILSLCRKDYK